MIGSPLVRMNEDDLEQFGNPWGGYRIGVLWVDDNGPNQVVCCLSYGGDRTIPGRSSWILPMEAMSSIMARTDGSDPTRPMALIDPKGLWRWGEPIALSNWDGAEQYRS